jgi:hypothetical protein
MKHFLWLWSIKMWREAFAQSNLFRRKRVFFAQWAGKNCPGGNFWAKIHDGSLNGMNNKSTFCHFLGYEYKKCV